MIRSPWSSNDESRLRGLLFRKDGWAGNPAMKFYQIDLPWKNRGWKFYISSSVSIPSICSPTDK